MASFSSSEGSFNEDKSMKVVDSCVHTKERQNELKAARKFYEVELARERAALKNLKVTAENIKVETLPDKGAKLRSSLEKQMKKVKELNEQLNHVSANIDEVKQSGAQTMKQDPPQKLQLPTIVDLTKDHTNLNELGAKALETHQKQQNATVKTLERLHGFLKNCDKLKTEQPNGLKVSLLPHQIVGLAWLEKREHEKPAGGILADDMGLGKTLMLISLILKQKQNEFSKEVESSDGEMETQRTKSVFKGNTLVVCPASVMDQWGEEIKSKVKTGYLSVCTHHGPKREKNPRRLAVYDVVLTTYTILQNDNKGEDPGPLLSIKWERVVLDEAHTIRNHKSHTAQAAFLLMSRTRWALTGTPIHNKHDDFYSLLKFLKCKPFDDLLVWKRMIDNKGESGTMRLHLLSKSLLLRRTKDEIQQEGGLKDLKPKQFKIVEVKLDPEEFVVYNKLFHFSGTLLAQYIHQQAEKQNLLQDGLNIRRAGPNNPFKDHPELGKLYNEMISFKGGIKTHHILVLLLRLRQACCHTSLVTEFIDKHEMSKEGIEDSEGNDLDLVESMLNLSIQAGKENSKRSQSDVISSSDPVFKKDRCSSKMRATIDCLMEIINSSEDKVIVVSQWTSILHIFENYLKSLGIKSVPLNGSIPVKERGDIIKDFNNSKHGPKVMLLSLTAGGTGLNLIGANHLILFDIHWNPQLEAQACDRIYRVGQTKTVHIYKIICKDTIEERILKLQEGKLELAKGVLSGSSIVQSSKLKLDDLKLLFNIR